MEKTAGKKSVGKQKILKIAVDVEKGATKDATLSAVAQSTTTKLTATLSSEVESVKTADFSVVRSDSAVIPVKSVALDAADKTKVTIETFTAMKDGKEYTVTYTAPTEGKTVSEAKFTATNGVMNDIGLSSSTVTAGQAEEFKIQTLDVNGVVLDEYTYTQALSKMEVTVTPTSTGYMNGDKLYLPSVGDTAAVKIAYHTYKYENGVEVGAIEKTFTITAVQDTSVMSQWNYTVGANGKVPAWNSAAFKATTQIAVGDGGKAIHFLFKDNKGVVKTANYKIKSSDSSTLLVAEGPIDTTKGNEIIGVKTGTAYIIVEDNTGAVVTTLPVTVIAARKATRLVLDKSSLRLSASPDIDAEKVKVTVKDQYNEDMSWSPTNKPTCISKPVGGLQSNEGSISDAVVITPGGFTFKGSELARYSEGTYVYRITATVNNVSVSTTLTVTVSDSQAQGVDAYSLSISNLESDNSVDIAAKKATDAKTLQVKMVRNVNSVAREYVDLQKVELLKTDGSVVFSTDLDTIGLSGDKKTAEIVLSKVTGAAIKADGSLAGKAIDKYIATGNYVVKATSVNGAEQTQLITVKDSQIIPTIEVLSNNADKRLIDTVFADSTKVKFYYDGNVLGVDNYYVASVDHPTVGNVNTSYTYTTAVKSVTIWYNVADDKVNPFYVQAKVDVNQYFSDVAYAAENINQ